MFASRLDIVCSEATTPTAELSDNLVDSVNGVFGLLLELFSTRELELVHQQLGVRSVHRCLAFPISSNSDLIRLC